MSLIHEALRKARQEAAHRDDPGVVYPGGLTGRRPYRSMAVGVAVGAVVALAVAAMVWGALWLTGRGHVAELPSEPDTPLPIAESAVTGEATETLGDEPVVGSSSPEPTSAQPPELSATLLREPAVEQDDDAHIAEISPGSGSRTVTFAQPTPDPAPASGSREFVAEADLGYASLSLDYIVFRPVDPFAQINGFDVRVGSTIEGFSVEEITADSVRLRDHRGTLVLRAE